MLIRLKISVSSRAKIAKISSIYKIAVKISCSIHKTMVKYGLKAYAISSNKNFLI